MTAWHGPGQVGRRPTVKIEKTEIGGMPIKQVRDVLRRLRGGHRGDFIGTRQQIAERAGRDITDALVADGLLEPYASSSDAEKDEEERIISRRYSSGGPYFCISRAGLQLTSANMLKRIDRARANRYVAELLDRADSINANPDLLYRVAKLWTFGSYITGAADLGDIDLVVELEYKKEKGDLRAANLARVKARGRDERWNDEWEFGRKEVRGLLKARCSYLSLFEMKPHFETPMRLIYPRSPAK
jgi:hypothetical protein